MTVTYGKAPTHYTLSHLSHIQLGKTPNYNTVICLADDRHRIAHQATPCQRFGNTPRNERVNQRSTFTQLTGHRFGHLARPPSIGDEHVNKYDQEGKGAGGEGGRRKHKSRKG